MDKKTAVAEIVKGIDAIHSPSLMFNLQVRVDDLEQVLGYVHGMIEELLTFGATPEDLASIQRRIEKVIKS